MPKGGNFADIEGRVMLQIDWQDRVGRYLCPCGGTITLNLEDAYYATRGACDRCGAVSWLHWHLRASPPANGLPKHEYATPDT